MCALKMPPINQEIIKKQKQIVRDLKKIIPQKNAVISEKDKMQVYESDGLTAYRQMPMIVVIPENTEQICHILKYCHQNEIKVVPRGAGTSLSGGALPLADGILISMAKFNKILEVDLKNRCAVVQPGVTNLAITEHVKNDGFYYAPDPSSQIACTIGGNVAENSGGVHCLKYGLTTNNILALKVVLISGEIVEIGGKFYEQNAYDMLGIITGSEGLLALITEITVRLKPNPISTRAMLVGFQNVENAGKTVADIIAKGIIPAGMEMMDHPAINAAEDFVNAGYPRQAQALLIIEIDGSEYAVEKNIQKIKTITEKNKAISFRASKSEQERLNFWAGRKAAFPAIGRISPDYYCMDGTIPRKKMPYVLREIQKLEQKYQLKIANVFHAGDGNLHPLILYDANQEEQLEKAEKCGAEILKLCVKVGGVLTGEHGVGVEKRDLMHTMFNENDLNQQQRIKCAFDEKGLLNPGKIFPQLHRCAELGRIHIHKGKIPFPEIPRF